MMTEAHELIFRATTALQVAVLDHATGTEDARQCIRAMRECANVIAEQTARLSRPGARIPNV